MHHQNISFMLNDFMMIYCNLVNLSLKTQTFSNLLGCFRFNRFKSNK